jgi:predicted glycosyltransferase
MTDKKKSILFAAYGGGHMKVLLPVVQELLQENGEFQPMVLAFTTAKNDCKERNVPCQTMLDFVDLFPPQAMEMGRRLANELSYHAIDLEESAAYLGISFLELAQEIGEEEAYKKYKKEGRKILHPVQSMEKLLAKLKPDMVVSTNSPRSEMALLKAANNLGIPSICVVDFYIDKVSTWLAENWCGTKICVLDEFVKKQLLNDGRNPEHIVVTGNPAFDHYGSKTSQEEAEKYRKENIKGCSKLIAYASTSWVESSDTPDKQLKNEILIFLMQECERLGYRLSHRQHPGEAMVSRPLSVLNGNEVTLETFMSSADLLVTFPSTIIYEARLLGVPTIVLGMSELIDFVDYAKAGNYEIIDNFEEISVVLESLSRRNEDQPPTHKKASKRVIEVIKGMAI